MEKELFIINSLEELGIPLTSTTGKCIVSPINIGYRAAGWSASGFTKLTKKYFPGKPKIQPIFTYLLILFNKAYCTHCKNVLDTVKFSSNKSNPTMVQSVCKVCTSSYRRDFVDTNFYNAKRRAEVLDRTPAWADMAKVRKIYSDCPKGYHVDHIYPLNGDLVSGLHVETNLQYLTAEENMSKGNKMPVSTSGEADCFTRS